MKLSMSSWAVRFVGNATYLRAVLVRQRPPIHYSSKRLLLAQTYIYSSVVTSPWRYNFTVNTLAPVRLKMCGFLERESPR